MNHKKEFWSIKKLLFIASITIGAATATLVLLTWILVKITKPKHEPVTVNQLALPKLEQVVVQSEDEKKEVYLYNPGKVYAFSDPGELPSICSRLNSSLATLEQIQDAYGKGASWCAYGWTSSNTVVYVLQQQDLQLCNGEPGVVTIQAKSAGVLCYGVKPPLNTPGIMSFNRNKWSMYE